jgi:hypothetical protein
VTKEPRGDRVERDGDRPKLTRRDTWHLVFSTYKASFPYILIFVVGMLVATWFVTTVLFR